MPRYIKFNSSCWSGLIEASWQGIFSDIDQWIIENSGDRVVDLPSRKVLRIATPRGVTYVKIIFKASDLSGWRKIAPALKWYFRPSRALSILRVSQKMLDSGIHCPVPVLAARCRSRFGWPTDIFISEECVETNLYDLLPNVNGEEADAILASVASELNRFHKAGFVHGDCIPPNLSLNAKQELVYFDNDRTVQHPFFRTKYAQRRNLVQFGYRLVRQLESMEFFHKFLECYAAFSGWTVSQKDTEIKRIIFSVKRRLGSVVKK